VGSCTINGDAVKPVWDFLSSLATLKLRGKVGAAVGSSGWSGEAVKMIEDRLKGIKFKVPAESVRAHLVPSEDDLVKAKELGVALAKALVP
jgi:flavorubredoxin